MLSKLDSMILIFTKILISAAYMLLLGMIFLWSLAAITTSLAMYMTDTPLPHINHAASQMLWLTWTMGSVCIVWNLVWNSLTNSTTTKWLWFMRKLWP